MARAALITGAAGGIGAAVARAMADHGYHVVVSDIDPAGEEVAAALGDGASFVPHDVTSEDGWRDAVAHAVSAADGLAAIVNCAGFIKGRIKFVDTSLELWRQHFAINCDSAFLACKYGIPAMAERGGSIVNFSSGLAHKLNADAAPYCASKAAVITTTSLGAMAGAPHKVRVNCLLPGAVETPMFYRNLQPGQTREELRDFFARQHPIGRVGTTDDMAEAVLFLCSDQAGFITGAALPIDGGQTL